MFTIVTTTINKPVLLKGYCDNIKKFGHKENEINFIIIGDKKTPSETSQFCADLTKRYGYQINYYNTTKQLNFLKNFPALRDHIPFNCVQRRNIGILIAYLNSADIIATIDDDNFVLEEQDFIGRHSIVGRENNFLCAKSASGWYNVCEILRVNNNLPIFHRGFPLSQRGKVEVVKQKKQGKIIVNAGLWLEAPDIDAMDWIKTPVQTKSIVKKYQNGIGVDVYTYSPFNSQNTALAREAIPAYFLSPYLNRYDDIWASYIINRIADYLGHFIHFGPPLVKQQRNQHNYFIDLDRERFGMEATDYFIKGLDSIKLKGSDYKNCYAEIVNYLAENKKEIFPFYNKKEIFPFNENRHKIIIDGMIKGMKIWRNVFSAI